MKLFDRRGQLTFPESDYKVLLAEAQGKKSVLEFGPGFSTYALIEAGVERILCCEYLEKWLEFAKERFKDYPQVEIIPFLDEPEAKADIVGEFDMAFVDSPKGYAGARVIHKGQQDCSRLNTCLLALKHAPLVLLHDASRPLERGTLGRLNQMGHRHSFYRGTNGLARIVRNEDTAGASLQGAK